MGPARSCCGGHCGGRDLRVVDAQVRRGFVAEKYAVLIDALYGGRDVQHIETLVKFEDGRSGVVAADLHIENVRVLPAAELAAAANA